MSDDPNQKHFPPTGDSRETFEGNRFEDARMQKVHAQLMREKEEPSENFSPMPLFFVALFMGLSFWGGVYIAKTAGNFDPFHYDDTTPVGMMAGGVAGPVEVDMMTLGRSVYSRNCAACHQGGGQGIPGVYPTLVNADWVQDSPERLVKLVLSGLGGPITVNGSTYNNQMTPFGGILNDQQIAAVLTYIRTDSSYNNDSYAVSADLVASVRADYGGRSDVWTQAELDAIHGPVTGNWAPSGASAETVESEGGESASLAVEANGTVVATSHPSR